jgi:hypothetical protein
MDEDSVVAVKLLNTLALINETIINFSHTIRLNDRTISIKREIELRNFRSGPTLETHVERKMPNGDVWVGSFDLDWNAEHWTLSAWITLYTENSDDIIQESPDLVLTSYDELLEQLPVYVATMLENFKLEIQRYTEQH